MIMHDLNKIALGAIVIGILLPVQIYLYHWVTLSRLGILGWPLQGLGFTQEAIHFSVQVVGSLVSFLFLAIGAKYIFDGFRK